MRIPKLLSALSALAIAGLSCQAAFCEDVKEATPSAGPQASAPSEGEKAATPSAQPLTLAIFPFEEKGEGVKDLGEKGSLLIFSDLCGLPGIEMVDRKYLEKALEEQGLSKSGMVSQEAAVSAGQLVGAKLIVTGAVFKVGSSTLIVAKLISTETSRVLGFKAKGSDNIEKICQDLSNSLSDALTQKAFALLPPPVKDVDVVARLNEIFGNKSRPKVFLACKESHVGLSLVDPAVETELKSILLGCGFEVVGSLDLSDITINSEGLSESAFRRNLLSSAKGRVEMSIEKTSDKSLIAAGREVAVGIDATPGIAGKQALQNASNRLALSLFPKIPLK